ncbi:U-Asilidin(1)-Mar3a-like [Leguminivora glycinivorella]|uniref:U-Asilidin(1)-Mar3a-like n=1 Tax=Leguminivora glycinivorella TaxID=1035111 RepID=UPI00200CF1C1|nr:U-Asilidin(1)-Mar3a-like [Leguminivora glycinivorella]
MALKAVFLIVLLAAIMVARAEESTIHEPSCDVKCSLGFLQKENCCRGLGRGGFAFCDLSGFLFCYFS